MRAKRYVIPILIAILLLAAALRVWGITSESYWLDEAISIRQAQVNYATSIEMLKHDVNFPFYIILLHSWIKLFDTSEFSSRFLSVIFGVLSVGMIYLLAKKLFSERVAIITVLLMSFSPILIYYSQEARSYSLLVLLTIVSFYFFISYLEKRDTIHLIAYVFFSLLLIYTHIFSFLVILIQNVYVLYIYRFRIKPLLKWFAGQLALFILFIPWLPILFGQISNSSFSTLWIPKPNVLILLSTSYAFFGGYLVLLIFIALLIVFILTKKFKTIGKNKLVFVSLWIILPFLVVVTYSLLFSSLYNTRYMLFTLPAIYLLFAVTIDTVMPKKKFISWIIVFVLIVSSFISVADQVKRIDKDDWRTTSEYIKQNVKENDAVFINPFYQQDPFTYYYDPDCFKMPDTNSCNFEKHRVLSLSWVASCCNATTELTATDGKNELRDYLDRDIWLINVRPETYDFNNSLFTYFNSSKRIILFKEFGDIKIYEFR